MIGKSKIEKTLYPRILTGKALVISLKPKEIVFFTIRELITQYFLLNNNDFSKKCSFDYLFKSRHGGYFRNESLLRFLSCFTVCSKVQQHTFLLHKMRANKKNNMFYHKKQLSLRIELNALPIAVHDCTGNKRKNLA